MAVPGLIGGLVESGELDKSSSRNFGLAILCVAIAGALTYEDSTNRIGNDISNNIIYGFLAAAALFFVGSIWFKKTVVMATKTLQELTLGKIQSLTAAELTGAETFITNPIDRATKMALLLADPNDSQVRTLIERELS